MAGDMNFQFKISANFADLKAAFTQIKTDFNQTVNDLKKAGQDIKIKVKLDIAGLNTDIQNVRRTIAGQLQQSAGQSIKVKIEADANAIRADLAAIKPQIQAAVAAMSGLHIKIPVVADLTALRAQLAAAIPSLSSGLSQPIALKIGIDMQHLRNQLVLALRMVQAAMNVMANMGQSINLNVNLSGAVTGLVTAINELKAEVIRLRQAMGSRGGAGAGGNSGGAGSGALGGFSSALQSARTAIMQFVATVGSLYGLKAFAAITDEAKQLESKIRLITASQQEANQVMASLREIAKNNLSALSPTVELYSKMSSATKNLEGGSTALNTRLTDIVSKLVTISGSSGPAAEGAIIQFGQALSGNFSSAGQELNSIIEQAPALADAIAKSYGVTRGELKKLGADGKITAADVVNGLMRQGQEVDAQFKKIESTIGGTATTASDALKHLLVDFDNVVGVSRVIIGVLVTLRDSMDEIVLAAKLVGAALLVAFGPALANLVVVLTTKLVGLTVNLVRSAMAATGLRAALFSISGVFSLLAAAMAGWSIGEYLRKEFLSVELFGIALAKNMTILVEKIAGFFSGLSLQIQSAWNNSSEYVKTIVWKLMWWLAGVAQKYLPVFGQGLADSLIDAAKSLAPDGVAGAALDDALSKLKNQTAKSVSDIEAEFDALADAAIASRQPKKVEQPGEVTAKSSKLKPQIDANALRKVDAEQALQNLEAEYQRGDMLRNAYYLKKAQLIAQIHDLEIQSIRDKAIADGKLRQDAHAAKLADLQQQYAKETDLNKKAELQKQIVIAKKPPTKTDEDVKNESKVITDIALAKKAKQAALDANANERRQSLIDAQKELLKAEQDNRQAALEAAGNKYLAKEAELEQRRKDMKNAFRKEREATIAGDTAAEIKTATAAAERAIANQSGVIDKLIDTEKAKLNLERVGEEIKQFTDRQNTQLKNIDLLKDRGQLSNRDAENQKAAVNEATAARLTLYRDELQRLATEGVPQAQQALAALEQQLREIPVEAEANFDVFWSNMNENMKQTAESTAKSGLSDFFMDLASGAKSGSDAVRDFARSFAASMARMASDALATWAVMKLIGFATGTAGASPTGEINLGVNHSGGIAGGVGARRQVDVSAFGRAPRYHVGGIAGFKPGEVPAVLMKGEEVLTKNDPRHVANGGGQGSSVRIINNIDPNMMHDYMSSSAGEQVIINMIERNVGSIKQLLR